MSLPNPVSIKVTLAEPLPAVSLVEAITRALEPLRDTPIPIEYRGSGFASEAYPRREFWLEARHRISHEVALWARHRDRPWTLRDLGEHDVPSEGLAVESVPLGTIEGMLLYVIVWEDGGIVVRPVSHAAREECEP